MSGKKVLKKKKATKKSLISKGHSDWISDKKLPKVKADPEEVPLEDGEDEFMPDIPDHPYTKYPPPKRNYEFRRKWRDFIIILSAKKNFNETFLFQLEILCDLFVEYEDLTKFIRKNGQTYEAFGRQGKAIKPFPQVGQLNKVKADINAYLKMLELNPGKAVASPKEPGAEWS